VEKHLVFSSFELAPERRIKIRIKIIGMGNGKWEIR